MGKEVASTTSYIPLPCGFKSHWRRNKQNPAGMYEWLAVTFRAAVVSKSISRQIVENYPGFPPPQNSPSVSSMDVKTQWYIDR